MKATGVVRRIDDLGRIVIPKEIRRNLGIRDGESLEIFIENESIVLKKHNQMNSYEELGNMLCSTIASLLDISIIITDREKIICTDESLKNLKNKKIDQKLVNLIDNRENYESQIYEILNIEETVIEGFLTIYPIISSIDSLGLVVIVSKIRKNYFIFAKLVANFLVGNINIE